MTKKQIALTIFFTSLTLSLLSIYFLFISDYQFPLAIQMLFHFNLMIMAVVFKLSYIYFLEVTQKKPQTNNQEEKKTSSEGADSE